jgi:hypothetical protein
MYTIYFAKSRAAWREVRIGGATLFVAGRIEQSALAVGNLPLDGGKGDRTDDCREWNQYERCASNQGISETNTRASHRAV